MERPQAIAILSEAAFGRTISFNTDWIDALKLAIADMQRCNQEGDSDEPLH